MANHDEDDEFEMSDIDFEARLTDAHPAEIIPVPLSRDERVSLAPVEFLDAMKALLRTSPGITVAAQREQSTFRDNKIAPVAPATYMRTEDLAKQVAR